MRVLFTTWAWPSHYFPMVPIAWALRAAGHDVRMASQPDLLPTMAASGLPSTVVGRDVDMTGAHRRAVQLLREAGGRPPEPTRLGVERRFTDHLTPLLDRPEMVDSFWLLRAFEDEIVAMFKLLAAERAKQDPKTVSLYVQQADAMVDDLLALARDWRPDLIVYDPLTHAAPMVSKLLGIPAVRNLFGPDVSYFVPMAGAGWLLGRFGLTQDDIDTLGTATIDPTPPSLQYDDSIAPTHRLHTRYVPYNRFTDFPTWLPDRPEKPRICLTWGTTLHKLLGVDAFLPGDVLRGCAKLADERDAELVLAITGSQRPLLPDLPTGVRVIDSAPLDALLPTCQLLVHQGGAGTMMNGLRHGLPQLILPHMFDEAANAVQLESVSAGRMLSATGTSAAELVEAGSHLLDEARHRDAARRLQREMADLPSPAEIVPALEALV